MAILCEKKIGHKSMWLLLGAMLGALGRQIKYWILGVVKRLLYSKKWHSRKAIGMVAWLSLGLFDNQTLTRALKV